MTRLREMVLSLRGYCTGGETQMHKEMVPVRGGSEDRGPRVGP